MNVSVPVMKPVIVLNKIFPMPLSVTMGVGNKEARYLKWLEDKFANDQDVARLLVRIYDTVKDYPGTVMKSSGILGTMQVRVLRTFLAEHAEALSVLSGMISGNQVKSTTIKIPASVRSASASLESVDLDVIYGHVDEVPFIKQQGLVGTLEQLRKHPNLNEDDVSQLTDLLLPIARGRLAPVTTDQATVLEHTQKQAVDEPISNQSGCTQLTVLDETPIVKLDRVNSIPAMYADPYLTQTERMGLLSTLSERIEVLREEDKAVIEEKQYTQQWEAK